MNKTKNKTALIVLVFFLVIHTAAAINIISPNTQYSNNKSLTVEVTNSSNFTGYNYSVKADDSELVQEAGFNGADNGDNLINNSHDISNLETGSEVNVSIKAYNRETESVKKNSTVFTVNREDPEFNVIYPENNSNISQSLQVNISNQSKSNIYASYKIEEMDSGFQSIDLVRSLDIESKGISVGEKSLKLKIEDEAGNNVTETYDFTFDNQTPEYNGSFNSDQYVNESLNLEKDFTKISSSLKNSNYSVKQNGDIVDDLEGLNLGEEQNLGGKLNHSSSYDLEIIAEDFAGNLLNKTISFNTDFESPGVEFFEPSGKDFNASGDQNFDIGFNEGDSESGISGDSFVSIAGENVSVSDGDPEFYSVFVDESGTQLDSSGLVATYDTTRLDDGVYDVLLNVRDNAGNSNRTEFEMSVSNNAPNITSVKYDGEDLSEVSVVGEDTITVETDYSGVAVRNITYQWGSQDIQEAENGEFSAGVNEGEYNLDIQVEDYVGKTVSTTFEDVLVDKTDPGIEVEKVTSDGWRQSHEVTVACSDDGSGIDGSAVFSGGDKIQGWEEGEENTFEVEEHGENEIEFRCRDQAGNEVSDTLTLKIDSQEPEILSTAPDRSSDQVEANTDFELSLNEESFPSGLSVSESNISVSNGGASSLELEDNVLSSEITNLPYNSQITAEGYITDEVGNKREFKIDFETKEEPADWIQIAEAVEAEEEMVLGVMQTDIGSGVGNISVDIQDSDSIRNFELKRSDGGEASVMIVEDDEAPENLQSPSRSTYRFAGVETEGIDSSEIITSEVIFEVDSDWFESNGGEESIQIMRNQGDGWNELNTSIDASGDTVLASAEVREFSWFAVTSDSNSGFDPVSFIPSIGIGLSDLITVLLLGAISLIVLYLLELMELIRLPFSLTDRT